jgi:hypothetical protein
MTTKCKGSYNRNRRKSVRRKSCVRRKIENENEKASQISPSLAVVLVGRRKSPKLK